MAGYDLLKGLLPAPLDELNSDGGLAPTPFVFGDKSLITSDENWYILCLTPQEATDLTSIVDMAAPIVFPDSYASVLQKYSQLMQYPNQIPEGSCMDLCQLIADCIDDPEGVAQQAIINAIAKSTSQQLIDSAQLDDDLILGLGNNLGCDDDILWGGVNNLVEQLNTNNEDALQILEVATNSNEWVTDVMAGVFGVKAPLVQSALEWGLFIQDNIMENYEAQVTTDYLDSVKCDLFCIAQLNNCDLTPQDLVDFFFGRLSSQLTFQSLLNESLEFIFFGVWTGSEIADAMMLSQLVFRAQFGRWFSNISFRSIDLNMRLGFDDPSNDWIELCDACGWTHTFDFIVDNTAQGWATPSCVDSTLTPGGWIAGTYQCASCDGDPAWMVEIEQAFTATYIETVAIHFCEAVTAARDDLRIDDNTGQIYASGIGGGALPIKVHNVLDTISYLKFNYLEETNCATVEGGETMDSEIIKIVITGQGSDPF